MPRKIKQKVLPIAALEKHRGHMLEVGLFGVNTPRGRYKITEAFIECITCRPARDAWGGYLPCIVARTEKRR